MGDRRSACMLADRPDGKELFRWEENIKMDLQEFGWASMDWIDQAQYTDRWWVLVNVVVNLWVS
jgi:hypothetical protein